MKLKSKKTASVLPPLLIEYQTETWYIFCIGIIKGGEI
jgi:hypothetical protein